MAAPTTTGRSGTSVWSDLSDYFELYVMPTSYYVLLFAGVHTARILLIPKLHLLQEFKSATLSTSLPLPATERTVQFYAIILPLTWCLVRYTDPGTIPRRASRQILQLYSYDEVMYPRNKVCSTCHCVKRARSKHCRHCDRCVMRFDHHCGWVANCIGLCNHRWFILFLFLHTLVLFHGTIVSMDVIRVRVWQAVQKKMVFAHSGELVTGFGMKVAYALEPNLMLYGLLLLITAVMVLGFLVWHVYLIGRNMTTNESYKWAAIMEACRNFEAKHGVPLMKAWQDEVKNEPQEVVPEFDKNGLPVRIYDKGVLQNIKEVLRPHLLMAEAKDRVS